MGFLDKLLGNAAKQAISNAIDNVTGNHSASNSAPAARPQAYSEPAAPAVPELSLEQKLDKILASEFPSYQVQKNVDPRSLGATDTYLMPYAYMICAGSDKKLIIMMPDRNTCSSRAYRFSRQFAENNGITLINFLLNSPNEESYIINRLHQYL